MIKVRGLNKYYNKGKSNQIHVIDDTSLELPSKGLITFLGHSGSGKTTLLNVIGGLDKATGEIEYDGERFKNYQRGKIDKFRSKNIGYVFQNYNLLLEETVYDNLRIALDLIGITDPVEQKKRIEYSLKSVGMFKYRKKVASFLSGGQQQRVSIARALVKKTKLIIADEPTGNLDSKNTVEVMNILKKISEHALVLLVTHEENVANFYSDYIYEIKDGRIINERKVDDSATFTNNDDSVIYLKDLKETDYSSELGNITIHSDNEEELKINFNIIVKGGNIYLKSDKPVKLLEQTNIRLVNDNFKQTTKEDISSIDYDISWYDDTKTETRVLKKFWKRITNSFISFRAVGKKQKFLYVCLGLIGIITSIGFALLCNAVKIDTHYMVYSDKINTYYVDSYHYDSTYNCINTALEKKCIDDLFPIYSSGFDYQESVTYRYSTKVQNSIDIVPFYDYNVDFVCGSAPKKLNEVVISESLAQSIQDKTHRSYEEILGLSVNVRNCNLIVSGISRSDNYMAHVSKDCFEMIVGAGYYYDGYSYSKSHNYTFGEEEFYSEFDLRCKKYEDYEIIKGNDVSDSEDLECVISKAYSDEQRYYIGSNISLDYYYGNVLAKVVGIFDDENNGFMGSNTIVVNKDIKTTETYLDEGLIFDGSKNIKLIEGDYPKNSGEVIVSIYAGNYSIGDTIYESRNKYTIVGLYTGIPFFQSKVLFNSNDYTLEFTVNNGSRGGNLGFKVLDYDKVKDIFTKEDMRCFTLKDFGIYETKLQKEDILKAMLIVFAVTTAASALFVYFTMRSKMLSDIYSIGVYRSLGASCGRINRKYLSDIFILTTFTALIGYLVGVIGYGAIVNAVNSLSGQAIGANLLMFDFGVFALGLLAVYAIMNVFGMLPILMLEQKTPSEIGAKYDI